MATFFWFGGSGSLDDQNNWIQPDPDNPRLPAFGDDVYVDGTGTLTGPLAFESSYILGGFDLQGALSGNLVQVDGELSLESDSTVDGYVVVNGTIFVSGAHVQSAAFDDNGSVTL